MTQRTGQEYYTLSEVVGPGVSLIGRWALGGPLAIAVAAGAAAFLVVPSAPSGDALKGLTSLFGTYAQIIATLLVALALQARYVELHPLTAALTLGYVSTGLVAAGAGASTGMPHWSYAVLMGLTVGGGVGALTSTLLVGYKALRSEAAAERRTRIERIANPTEVAKTPSDPSTHDAAGGTD